MEDSDKSRLEAFKKLKEVTDNPDSSFQEIETLVKELKEVGNDEDKKLADQVLRTASLKTGECQSMLNKFEQEKNKDPFMYVYALHSLGKQDSALTNYNALNVDKSDYHSALLYSQILYKLDQKEKAAETYETVLTSGNPGLDHDLNEVLTNLLASYCNTEDLTEEKIKEIEQKISGEILSDFAFNSAAAYASVDKGIKVASKKLKESYQVAQEHEEADSTKFPILASYIAAKLLGKATDTSMFNASELVLEKNQPKKFENRENEAAYFNNLVCAKALLGNAEGDFNKLSSK